MLTDWKHTWLAVAEIVDALRVFPRLLLASSFAFLAWYSWFALNLVVGMVERMSVAQSADTVSAIVQNIAAGIIGITIPMIGNTFAKIADVYLNTGRKWG